MITAALLAWPVVTIILVRLLPWPNALIASMIGGYLLLPEQGGFDPPLLPEIAKDTIPCLTLLLIAVLAQPGQQSGAKGHSWSQGLNVLDGWVPRSVTGFVLLAALVVGAILTALTNGDRLHFGTFSIPGLSLYDGFSLVVGSASLIVPLLLGRKYLAHSDAHRLLLVYLVIAGLGYSFLALAEIRLSPQLNRWVYGFFPHSWIQHVRGGGFRPLVFLNHGLWLAIFLAMTIIAALGLSRAEPKARVGWLLAAAWLLMTLVLAKSLGALLITLLIAPVVLFLSCRLQLFFAACIAIILLTYPLLRGADLVPTDQLVNLAERIDESRAQSLEFRFDQEDRLIQHANERPAFGWGRHGRSRVYDEFGRDISVVDGAWVISIGTGGWLRYVVEFGLLSAPIILLALRRRRYDLDMATVVLILVLVANLIDLIPNSTRVPITWLIAGALLGRLEMGRLSQEQAETKTSVTQNRDNTTPSVRPVSPYTRQKVPHHRRRETRSS